MKIKYQCEICGNIYDDKEKAEECESYGIDEPLLNIGAIITICDCKKTPIMFTKYRDVYPWNDYEKNCVPNGNILYYIENVCDKKIKCRLSFIEKSSPHSLRYIFYPVEEFRFFRIEMQQYQLKNQLKYYNKIESEE